MQRCFKQNQLVNDDQVFMISIMQKTDQWVVYLIYILHLDLYLSFWCDFLCEALLISNYNIDLFTVKAGIYNI